MSDSPAERRQKMLEEYQKYINETATLLLRSNPNLDDYKELALKDATWSSWVVSSTRRAFAYKEAVRSRPYDVGVQLLLRAVPTAKATAEAIADHIVARCKDLADTVKPAYYKILFKAASRFAEYGDIDPMNEQQGAISFNSKQDALAAVSKLNAFYEAMGMAPPAISLMGYDKRDQAIEVSDVAKGAT